MASNIILSSEDTIICPKCSHKFPIEQGTTRQTIEQHERDYNHLYSVDCHNLNQKNTQL